MLPDVLKALKCNSSVQIPVSEVWSVKHSCLSHHELGVNDFANYPACRQLWDVKTCSTYFDLDVELILKVSQLKTKVNDVYWLILSMAAGNLANGRIPKYS